MSFSQYVTVMTCLFFTLNDASHSMMTEPTSQSFSAEEDGTYLPLTISEAVYKRVKRNTLGSANTTECRNLHSKCGRWKNRNYCNHKDYQRFMEIKCRLSCELCKGEALPPDTNPACDDVRKGDCNYWLGQGYCTDPMYEKFMKVNCKRSCGLCPDQIEEATTVIVSTSSPVEPMRPLVAESASPTLLPTVSSTSTTTQDPEPAISSTIATTTVDMGTTASIRVTAIPETLVYNSLETTKTPVATATTMNVTGESLETALKETDATPVLNTTSFNNHQVVESIRIISSVAPAETTALTSAVMSTDAESIDASTASQTTSTKTNVSVPSTSAAKTTASVSTTGTSATKSTASVSTTSATKTTSLVSSTSVANTTTPATTTSAAITPPFLAGSTAPSDGCSDIADSCRFLIFLCRTSQFARTYCKKTCGICSKFETESTTIKELPTFQEANATYPSATTQANNWLRHSSSQPQQETTKRFDVSTTQLPMNDVGLSMKPTTGDIIKEAPTDDVYHNKQTELSTDGILLQKTTLASPTNDNTFVTPKTVVMPIVVSSSLDHSTVTMATPKTTTLAFQGCADEHPRCYVLPLDRCNSSSLMQLFCKRTCGLCRDSSSDVTTTSAFTTIPPLTSPSNNDFEMSSHGKSIYFRTTTSNQAITSSSDDVYISPITFRTTTTEEAGTVSEPDVCVDRYQACHRLVMHCDVNVNVTTNCRRTCGKCGSAATEESPTPASGSTQTPCEDTFSKCSEMSSACHQSDAIPFLKKSCPKTCGFCSASGNVTIPPLTTSAIDCYDTHDVCGLWAESGFCDSAIYPQMTTFMQANCRKSCRLCSTAAWSQWSECSLTCGGGQQTRVKMACHDESCGEPITERRACAMVVCPKHPGACEDRLSARACQQYKDKNACGEEIIIALCAATCRICRNETTSLEEWSDGENSTSNESDGRCVDRHQRCANWSARGFCEHTYSTYMERKCPKACGLCHVWKPWSQWTPCNATCGGGVQTRNRTCTSGQCVGESVDTITCNSFICHSCRNQVPSCNIMKVVGKCQNILYKVVCKETCGMCVPPPMKGRCADTNIKCQSSVQKCGNPAVAYACPVTCKKCAPPVDPPAVVTPPLHLRKSNTSDVCLDRHDGCPEAFAGGHCSDFRVLDICPFSCGQCKPIGNQPKSGVSTDITCANRWDFCDRLVEGCTNNLYIQQNCPVACNLCSTNIQALVRPSEETCNDHATRCPELAARGGCRNPTVAEGCKVSCQHPCTLVKKNQKVSLQSLAAKKCVDQHSLCGEYHALGKCENDFIKFLCPSSCQACDDDERSSIPICTDAYGAACLLYASKCALPFIQDGCAKTCGLCGGTLQCKDLVPKSCVALAEAGMCKVVNFREKCPVSCKTCTPPTSAGVATSDKSLVVSTECVDRITDCDDVLPFCQTELSVQASCRMSCGLCAASITEDDLRCIDIDPQRCSQVALTNQCRGRVALMCSKSCGRCRPAKSFVGQQQSCSDTFASCTQKPHLCHMRSVWSHCKRTCGKCFGADQEGTSAGTGSGVLASDQNDCKDHVDDCQMNEELCSASDNKTRRFMTYVCPKTCDACEPGTWTKWGTWSECSKSCNDDPGPLTADSGGNRTRTRRCLRRDICVGETTETGKCNKDRCPGQSIPQDEGRVWTEWGECSVTCGSGVRTRKYECLKTNCSGTTMTEMKNCTNRVCVAAWTPWSSWTSCLSTCGSASKMRMRSCLNTTRLEEETCPGAKMEEEVCTGNPPCPAWTTWYAWAPCNASCGEGTKTRTRTCSHVTNDSRCEGNDLESDRCVGIDCPRWSEWQGWKACSVTCGGGGHTQRVRMCLGGEGECGDEKRRREVRTCGGEACPSWQEWTKWTECSLTCGSGGVRERNRICEKNQTCDGDSKETESCYSDEVCIRWTMWSDFSQCSVTCGKGVKTRSRRCKSSLNDVGERKKECPGKSKQSNLCNCNICPDVGTWSYWGAFGDCSVTCGKGKQIRRRFCLNGIPNKGGCKGSLENIRSCELKICPIGTWTEWDEWTRCSASCGGGIKSKNRTCVGGVAGESGCPGENEVIEKCNERDCPTWSSWRSWVGCSTTCGGNGTRTRSKVCYDAIARKDVSDSKCTPTRTTRIFEACNVKVCPTWGEWGQWGPCSHSCGAGTVLRSRECLNGTVGSIGCEAGHNETREICNDWDCPSSCQSVKLKIYSTQSQSVNTKTYSSRDESINTGNTQSLHCFAKNDSARWLQINFDSVTTVSEISLQGQYFSTSDGYSWVKEFKIWYSNSHDGVMKPINNNSGRPRTFAGPHGPLTTARRSWNPISARRWRVEVLSSAPPKRTCMKIELFGCSTLSSDDEEGSGLNPVG